jgi:hypothetical protein
VLLGVGFLFPVLWPFGILGIAYFLYLVQREESFKKVVIGGFVAWTIKSLAALLWFLFYFGPMDTCHLMLHRTLQLSTNQSLQWIPHLRWHSCKQQMERRKNTRTRKYRTWR